MDHQNMKKGKKDKNVNKTASGWRIYSNFGRSFGEFSPSPVTSKSSAETRAPAKLPELQRNGRSLVYNFIYFRTLMVTFIDLLPIVHKTPPIWPKLWQFGRSFSLRPELRLRPNLRFFWLPDLQLRLNTVISLLAAASMKEVKFKKVQLSLHFLSFRSSRR